MNTDQDFIESARSALESSSAALDASTLSRLHSARSRALEAAGRQPSWLSPASALASAALVLVVGSVLWVSHSSDNHGVSTPEESEVLASEENLEISIDLDFYHWLDEQHATQAEA